MVVKQAGSAIECRDRFESSVILYGSQTLSCPHPLLIEFESSVILYGSQTERGGLQRAEVFESSVILYGSQT